MITQGLLPTTFMIATTFSKILFKNFTWGYKNLSAQMKQAVAFERQGGSAVEMLKSYCAIAQKTKSPAVGLLLPTLAVACATCSVEAVQPGTVRSTKLTQGQPSAVHSGSGCSP
jgi:hypothetical protein